MMLDDASIPDSQKKETESESEHWIRLSRVFRPSPRKWLGLKSNKGLSKKINASSSSICLTVSFVSF